MTKLCRVQLLKVKRGKFILKEILSILVKIDVLPYKSCTSEWMEVIPCRFDVLLFERSALNKTEYKGDNDTLTPCSMHFCLTSFDYFQLGFTPSVCISHVFHRRCLPARVTLHSYIQILLGGLHYGNLSQHAHVTSDD